MPKASRIKVCLIMTVQLSQWAFSLLCYETKIESSTKTRLTKCQSDLSVCYVASLLGYFTESGCSLKSGNFDGIGTTKGFLYFCKTDGCNSEDALLDIHQQYDKHSFSGLTIDDSASVRLLRSLGDKKHQKVAPRKNFRSRNKRGQHPDTLIDFVDYVVEDGADRPRLSIMTTAYGISLVLIYANH